ncbi:MAG TPA: hypothetical protein VIT88_10340 [Pyrinomonadaceae bacterium]
MNGIQQLKLLPLMLVAMICLASGCSFAQQPSATSSQPSSAPDRKILIVYISRTNNTKAITEMIRDNVVELSCRSN